MSYTFSRRDFMKYTAVAAVAVAGSSMFTGCSLISNPNRPTGKAGDTLKPGSGISTVTLHKNATETPLTYAGQILTCTFTVKSLKGYLSVVPESFQVEVTTDAGTKCLYTGNNAANMSLAEGTGTKSLAEGKSCKAQLVVKNLDLSQATKLVVKYWPRATASGTVTDSYNDVYGTWDITDALKESFASGSST